MGKLAERYGDAARSGVYGVRDGRVPRAAAVEADAMLVEVAGASLAAEWARVERAVGAEAARACVLLVPGAAALAHPEHHAVLEALVATARVAREAGRSFFAVMIDPEGRLGLPALYHEQAAQ